MKVRGVVGPDREDLKEIRVLSRRLRLDGDALVYEADEKHVETVLKEVGLEKESKTSEVPLPRDYEAQDADVELAPVDAHRYRRIAAVVNYLALDRPDLQFAAGVLGRTAARPTERSMANLTKLSRYLLGHRAVRYRFGACREEDAIRVIGFSDSDWAGCRGGA